MDLDMPDSSAALSGSTHKKLKQNELWDGIDALPTKGLSGNEEVDVCTKGKSKLYNDDTLGNGNKDASGSHGKSSADDDLGSVEEDGDEDYDDYVSDYEVAEADLYGYDFENFQSQFDNEDLPTGVEVPVPWMKEPASNVDAGTVSDGHAEGKSLLASSSIAAIKSLLESSSSSRKVENVSGVSVIEKLNNFKQFDMVEDYSDHHYNRTQEQGVPPKNWAKRIQEEWKILEENLPETIFVRVYESRMELLRSVIIGPAGTPYHDGLFVFDCLFPSNYPDAPPLVYYYSGGVRLNPNLYDCGKVCLSLLGTWSGDKNEKWIPGRSTMLQVLVSIQALILNAEPYYNEPGYTKTYDGPNGDSRSNKYNEDAFILSLKTMMYTLRKPPKYFEDLVKGHFQQRAHNILIACRSYADGCVVGTVTIKDGAADVSNANKTASSQFRASVKKMIDILINTFTRFGGIDCEQFRASA